MKTTPKVLLNWFHKHPLLTIPLLFIIGFVIIGLIGEVTNESLFVTITSVVLLGGVLFIYYRSYRMNYGDRKAGTCEKCGHTESPRVVRPGSLALEILLWLAMGIPGLIFSIWSNSNIKYICANCGNDFHIPPRLLV